MMNTRFSAVVLVAGIAFFSLTSPAKVVSKPRARPTAKWTSLAREVGQSEEHRERAIHALRLLPTLSNDLRIALKSSADRPLALEAICALNLQNLLPDLLDRVEVDSDGFTILAVNALMTDRTSQDTLRKYTTLLQPINLSHLATPVIVAMLEPLGRLKFRIPRATLVRLAADPSPDVRSGTLYYLRMMALRNNLTESLDLVTDMTSAPEIQVRLQAISISAEIDANFRESRIPNLKTPSQLNALCLLERGSSLKEACLSFLAVNVARR